MDHLCYQRFILFALHINFKLDCEFWPMENICRGMIPRNTAMKTTILLSFTGIFSIQVWILRFCLSVEDTWSSFCPYIWKAARRSTGEVVRWCAECPQYPARQLSDCIKQTGPDRKHVKNFPLNVKIKYE